MKTENEKNIDLNGLYSKRGLSDSNIKEFKNLDDWMEFFINSNQIAPRATDWNNFYISINEIQNYSDLKPCILGGSDVTDKFKRQRFLEQINFSIEYYGKENTLRKLRFIKKFQNGDPSRDFEIEDSYQTIENSYYLISNLSSFDERYYYFYDNYNLELWGLNTKSKNDIILKELKWRIKLILIDLMKLKFKDIYKIISEMRDNIKINCVYEIFGNYFTSYDGQKWFLHDDIDEKKLYVVRWDIFYKPNWKQLGTAIQGSINFGQKINKNDK